jgi:predicted O-methyltransferase YrrM
VSNRTIQLDDRTYEYLLAHSLREAPALAALRAETASHPKVNMQIAPEQGQFMQMLVRLTGARRAIEVGVFTGYSSLAVMLAMPKDGRLLACDISSVYTAVARRHSAGSGCRGPHRARDCAGQGHARCAHRRGRVRPL